MARVEKRAELAQQEINKEREQATEYFIDCEYLKKEISQLKAKLAKYQSDDYVLVPKEPTEKISETMCEVIFQVHGFQVSDYFNRTVYESMIKVMIEAGEIK